MLVISFVYSKVVVILDQIMVRFFLSINHLFIHKINQVNTLTLSPTPKLCLIFQCRSGSFWQERWSLERWHCCRHFLHMKKDKTEKKTLCTVDAHTVEMEVSLRHSAVHTAKFLGDNRIKTRDWIWNCNVRYSDNHSKRRDKKNQP